MTPTEMKELLADAVETEKFMTDYAVQNGRRIGPGVMLTHDVQAANLANIVRKLVEHLATEGGAR